MPLPIRRGLTRSRSFNSAATVRSRKWLTGERIGAAYGWLQFGRDCEVAEMHPVSLHHTSDTRCFNSAATVRSRKWQTCRHDASRYLIGFNSAATVRSRKSHDAAPSPFRVIELQFGRDCEVAEMTHWSGVSSSDPELQFGRDCEVAEIPSSARPMS